MVPVSIVNDTGTNESNHLTTKFHRCRSGSAGIRYGEVRGAGGASAVSVSEPSTGDMANMGQIVLQPTKVQARGLVKKASGVDIKSAWARILTEGQADNSLANRLQRLYITSYGVLLKSR